MFLFSWLGVKKVRNASRKNAGTCDQRTGAEHLEKFSASPGPVGRVAHGHSSYLHFPTLAAKCTAAGGRVRGKFLQPRGGRKRASPPRGSACGAQSMREPCSSF